MAKKGVPPTLPTVSKGKMHEDLHSGLTKKKMSPSSGSSAYALGVAKVVSVNYEELTVSLRILIGEEQEFQRLPIPLTFPGAGTRHFLGSLPNIGDVAIVGWMPQESGGAGNSVGTKIPVILTWVTPGVWAGHDWLVTQEFSPTEHSFSPKDASLVEGVFSRTRHKLRHAQPGNVLASSSQGSDLVLDEGVTLANRRCNEVRLRDQDQAFLVRALQHFEALAGTRVYAGMVQRDALFLPTQLFSDGYDWTDKNQVIANATTGLSEPLREEDLPSSIFEDGYLTPAEIFQRGLTDSGLTRPVGPSMPGEIDPFNFLKQGLFITEDGILTTKDHLADGVYGGKPVYRVSLPLKNEDVPSNAAIAPESDAFTEYRIEVAHTSDGRLPVTEQTDLFDAERLPRTNPNEVDEEGTSPNSPFIEWALGTVVGNDPFSVDGKLKYGLPLRPVIFDQTTNTPNPQLLSAIGFPIGQQAATLFRLTPPTEEGGSDTFWSVTKDGQVKISVGGEPKQNSVEATLKGGMHLFVGGSTLLDFNGGFCIRTKKGDPTNSNLGLDLGSDAGGVRIYGGGSFTASSTAENQSPSGFNSPAPEPSLLLEGRFNTTIKASQQVQVKTGFFDVDVSQVRLSGLSNIELSTGDSLQVAAKTQNVAISGKSTESYSGPKDGLPSNGPNREVTFTSLIPGTTVDKYTVVSGNREEEFQQGNHTTTIRVGNMTYETNLGTWTAKAGANSLALDSASGLVGDVVTGNINLEAKSGATTISGLASVTVKSTSGLASVSGQAGLFLGGPGKVGNIVSSSDLDPLTGLPLSTYGMGSPGHQIGLPLV